jgi:hypothetical protein
MGNHKEQTMKTGIKIMVTPEQREEVIRIARAHGLRRLEPDAGEGDFVVLYSKNDGDGFSIWDTEDLTSESHDYEEVSADLFIRTNGTCEEDWRPEPGETILLGPDEIPLEFITMTKDGTWFICHGKKPNSAAVSDIAKPKPKEWYELVSADNPALCWVWGEGENQYTLPRVVVGYDPQHPRPFQCLGNRLLVIQWEHAKFIAWVKDVK